MHLAHAFEVSTTFGIVETRVVPILNITVVSEGRLVDGECESEEYSEFTMSSHVAKELIAHLESVIAAAEEIASRVTIEPKDETEEAELVEF